MRVSVEGPARIMGHALQSQCKLPDYARSLIVTP